MKCREKTHEKLNFSTARRVVNKILDGVLMWYGCGENGLGKFQKKMSRTEVRHCKE